MVLGWDRGGLRCNLEQYPVTDLMNSQNSCAKLRREGGMPYIYKETVLQTGLQRLHVICKAQCPQASPLPYCGGNSVPFGDQKSIKTSWRIFAKSWTLTCQKAQDYGGPQSS